MKSKRLAVLSGSLLLAAFVSTGYASNGHYAAGIEGLKAASAPPAGTYYRGYLVHYDIDSVQGPGGDKLPGDNTGTVTALANRFIWITDKKFLGADYGMEAIVVGQRNSFDFRGLGFDETEAGVGDVFLGPVILAWHGQQWDSVFAAGYWFDTGDYSSINPVSIGKGFGSTMLTLGGAWHVNEARTWSLSALSRYEIKTEQDETDVTPGDSWLVEWGISHQLAEGLDVALVGYDGWQLESDRGGNGNAKVEQHAVGAEVAAVVPAIGAMLTGAVYTEYSNENRPEGELFRMSLTKRF